MQAGTKALYDSCKIDGPETLLNRVSRPKTPSSMIRLYNRLVTSSAFRPFPILVEKADSRPEAMPPDGPLPATSHTSPPCGLSRTARVHGTILTV